ncbi:amidohydrolase family protein [Halomonas sp. MCCC 1A17488]|uniref:amidohydrolase family protein n=1 Tax=unclassified Halomonas TaxID=2609666 RepID=UPI0018D1FF01|nr:MULTISPECIES: amidohydrolase family protein [unclassified Halomonas]MCE8018339.1 amidohydrolase family protein [Halomonas sp. MCCC 1A17488]MCG3241672.1 amidohydrolase family protein [Halomonas sp. MCCC 1A17488]QPP49297.1 amidohydrolase family protein [Halomonas sp. SS10-MC5]
MDTPSQARNAAGRGALCPESFAADTLLLLPEEVLLESGCARNKAVLVANGKFAEIDERAALLARHPELAPIALPGKLLMPGFIDAHHHLTQSLGKSLVFGEPSEIFKRIWVPLEASLDERLLYLSAKLAALEALRGGFTTAVDAGTRASAEIGSIAQAVEETGLRCVLGFICNDMGGGREAHQDGAAIRRDAERHLARWAGHALVVPSLAVSIPEVASDGMLRDVAALCGEGGAIFQTHVNEHLQAVERSLVARRQRPLEHLHAVGALGPQTLIAHATLVTPTELNLLRDTDTAVAFNPVASAWKGNAVAPALQMAALGIRFGLGTDGTRSDAFRLMDAAETSQRLSAGLATGDSSCGGGWLWLEHATRGSAEAAGLARLTGEIAPGLAADFLLLDLDVPEMTPSWDLPWELVRYANRDQIEAVFTNGRLRLWQGWPVDWDARALLAEVREAAGAAVERAPIQRVHATSSTHRAAAKRSGNDDAEPTVKAAQRS